VLITIGVVWLLINNGTIAAENLYRLIPYWPALLILAGLSLILRRIWWPLSGLLWLLAAGVFLWLLVAPPAFLPAAPSMELKRETFREPLDQAGSAAIELDLSVNPTRIYALEGSTDLIVADLSYLGEIVFDVSGTTAKTVRLDQTTGPNFWAFRWDALIGQDLAPWEIGLAPGLPLELRVDSGTGRTEMDLSGLTLESLVVDGGTGSIDITLPEGGRSYTFDLDIGTGSATIAAPEGATLDINVDGGTGSLTIDAPEGAGIQVEVRDGGTGSLRLPDGFDKVREGDDDDEGVWENEAYASTDAPLRINLDIGTGSVTVR
jgi:hypothetical protein